MTDQLPMPGPDKGPCEGNQEKCSRTDCPMYGTLMKPNRDGKRRIRGCEDPAARGRRNRRSGQKRQAKAARAIGVPKTAIAPGDEENFQGAVRVEVKSGAQVGPIITRYRLAEAQSEASRPIGDTRPFVFIAMPASEKDPGLLVVRLDRLDDACLALLRNRGVIE